MVDEMKDLDGLMSENSVKATIYSYWHFFFYRKLMIEYTTKGNTEYAKSSAENIDGKTVMQPFWTDARRITLMDNYAFYETF